MRVYSNHIIDAQSVMEIVGRMLGDFQQCFKLEVPVVSSPTVDNQIRWKKPTGDSLKLNADVSVSIGKEEVGIGPIIRDSEGMNLGLHIEIAETVAVRLASEVQNSSSISEDNVLMADIVELSRCGVNC
ncbi:hypothetical protein TIFTF001_039594 [Ficus carica]|uniref:Uncharacterized protein n=1 Tax=Ficus carica TaxID=3494 RepID=A0AA88JE87_FICCA|nr:hypothetical protein TIFTF001_039594 [Ficus carica]